MCSVEIEEGVEEIGYGAFDGCNKLQNITFPKSLKTISMSAFSRCQNLKELVIPPSVKEIEQYAFNGCTSLREIKFENSNIHIESKAFHGCSNLCLVYSDTELRYAVADAFDNANVFMTAEGRRNTNSYSAQGNHWQEAALAQLQSQQDAERDELAYKETMRELERTSQQTREERNKSQNSTGSASHPFDPNEIVNCFNCGGSGRIPFGYTLQQCPLCLGSGKQTAGKYMQNVTLPDNGGYNGSTIGTNNNSSQSSGTKHGYRTEYYYDTCDFCHGSGKCSSCVGKGYVINLGGSNYNCPVCKIPGNKYKLGNGVCSHCQNGKVKKLGMLTTKDFDGF